VPRVGAVEKLAIRSALGRVLAADVVSGIDVPSHDNSAMDGYALRGADLASSVVLRRIGLQLNLRDVRIAPEGGVRNVVYHVAIYAGRSDVPAESFRPQASEIEALAWFAPADVDRMLLECGLAPNMAFLWLAHGHRLVGGK